MTNFNELGLSENILKALAGEGYTTPTPIQAQAIPVVLSGRDLLGIAQTGTGKTAAFALPILQLLAANRKVASPKTCRVLVLSPTRELATQIADSFRTYGKHIGLRIGTVFGGVGYRPQIETMARGVDILVATPGRLLDHMENRAIQLGSTETFVLDEADQMLDLGFLKPIRDVVAQLPKARQNLFFSATMPNEIGKLANELLTNPAQVSVSPTGRTVDKIEQKIIHVEHSKKRSLLIELLSDAAMSRTLVFTRTKRGADRVAQHLTAAKIEAAAIHGNKSQGQRERALADFKKDKVRVLVATDIAARGIDIDQVTHVVNFELPDVPESYVHRIGRTARAGATGTAITLCCSEERHLLRDIERLTRQTIPSEDRRGDAELHKDTSPLETRSDELRQRQEKTQQRRGRGSQERPSGRSGGRSNDRSNDRPADRPTDRSGDRSGARREGPRLGRDTTTERSAAPRVAAADPLNLTKRSAIGAENPSAGTRSERPERMGRTSNGPGNAPGNGPKTSSPSRSRSPVGFGRADGQRTTDKPGGASTERGEPRRRPSGGKPTGSHRGGGDRRPTGGKGPGGEGRGPRPNRGAAPTTVSEIEVLPTWLRRGGAVH